MTFPRMDSVWALYALQKSMMLTPCGPRAVPTGGAGVAAPAWSCTLTSAAIFFLGGISCSLPSRGHDEHPGGGPATAFSCSRRTSCACAPASAAGGLDRLDLSLDPESLTSSD